MGAVLGSCAGAAICCAGAACCSCLCRPCEAAGVAAKNYAKIGYVVFQCFWLALALTLMFVADHLEGTIATTDAIETCDPDLHLSPAQCVGTSLMVRMSCVLFFFHLFVFLIILARNGAAAAFHDGCWGTKYVLLGALFVAFLWVPNSFVLGVYMKVAEWVSALFLAY